MYRNSFDPPTIGPLRLFLADTLLLAGQLFAVASIASYGSENVMTLMMLGLSFLAVFLCDEIFCAAGLLGMRTPRGQPDARLGSARSWWIAGTYLVVLLGAARGVASLSLHPDTRVWWALILTVGLFGATRYVGNRWLRFGKAKIATELHPPAGLVKESSKSADS